MAHLSLSQEDLLEGDGVIRRIWAWQHRLHSCGRQEGLHPQAWGHERAVQHAACRCRALPNWAPHLRQSRKCQSLAECVASGNEKRRGLSDPGMPAGCRHPDTTLQTGAMMHAAGAPQWHTVKSKLPHTVRDHCTHDGLWSWQQWGGPAGLGALMPPQAMKMRKVHAHLHGQHLLRGRQAWG